MVLVEAVRNRRWHRLLQKSKGKEAAKQMGNIVVTNTFLHCADVDHGIYLWVTAAAGHYLLLNIEQNMYQQPAYSPKGRLTFSVSLK